MAISEIISVLLLLVIIVFCSSLATVAAYRWLELQRLDKLPTFKERFIIEDVWFKSVNDKKVSLTLIIRNTGKVDVTIIHCLVNNVFVQEMTPEELFLKPGQYKEIEVRLMNAWVPNELHKISLQTLRGKTFTIYDTP
ncbi:MAG: hypothetical protein ABIJ47_14640 [Candidatus Bathyarchaeota archaeon]